MNCVLKLRSFISLISYNFQFITIRQFPPADKSLPPLNKSRWWIPTGKLKKDFCPKKISLVHVKCRSSNTPIKITLPYFNSNKSDGIIECSQ